MIFIQTRNQICLSGLTDIDTPFSWRREIASSSLQALVPLFFVVALGFAAGKFHSFGADQATGFNTLLVNLALLAMLFSSTVAIKRVVLLEDGPVLLALAVAYLDLYPVVVALYHWAAKRKLAEASLAGLLTASAPPPRSSGLHW